MIPATGSLTSEFAGRDLRGKHDVQLCRGTPLRLRQPEEDDDDTSGHPHGEDNVSFWAEISTVKLRLVKLS